jgi:hypothetical protein
MQTPTARRGEMVFEEPSGNGKRKSFQKIDLRNSSQAIKQGSGGREHIGLETMGRADRRDTVSDYEKTSQPGVGSLTAFRPRINGVFFQF